MFSNLPGRLLRVEKGAMCETEGHETVPATHCIQGETDSFGYEEICMCTPCYEQHREAADQPRDGYCEWGKHEGTNIQPYRDIDEGYSGPVYDACAACRLKDQRRCQEELDSYYNED